MDAKQTAIAVSIAVLFSVLVIVTIEAFYPMPAYDDYCDVRAPRPLDTTCNMTSQQSRACYEQGGIPQYYYSGECPVYEECSYCQQDFEEAVAAYNNISMLIMTPIAIAAIIFGIYYSITFIGVGFTFSGLFLLLYGTLRNFSNMNEFLRIGVIALELGIVLYLGIKKVNPKIS